MLKLVRTVFLLLRSELQAVLNAVTMSFLPDKQVVRDILPLVIMYNLQEKQVLPVMYRPIALWQGIL